MSNQRLPYMIRPMEPGDVPTVAAIDELSFPTPWVASSYFYELRHPKQSQYYVLLKPSAAPGYASDQAGRRWIRWLWRIWGRLEPSRVIGYVGFRFNSDEAHISTIAVLPDWRGRGLGELLLLTALEQAYQLGVYSVSLEVRPSNQVAQRLYRKYGFRFTGVHPGYYRDGEDAWLMRVTIGHESYKSRLAELRRAVLTRLPVYHDVGQNDGDGL